MKRFMAAVVASAMIATAISAGGVSAASLDQFTIKNYQVDMELGRDDENRSTLRTVETITVQFQDRDVNRGLERVFEKEYNNHPTSPKLESVKRPDGSDWKYHWSGDTLRIGDPDRYVRGEQVFVITFTERDVTREYVDTASQEFYWDVIGDQWRVPIEKASVKIKLADSIKSSVKSDMHCYKGQRGSDETCQVSQANGVYTASAANLGNHQGMTTALGFKPGTFAEYKQPIWASIVVVGMILAVVSLVILSPIALIIGGIMLYLRWRKAAKAPEVEHILKRPVAPEYIPPKEVSVLESAVVRDNLVTGRAVSAQIVDWAVRGYVTLAQVKEKTWHSVAEYRIEAKKDFSSLSELEQKMAKALFGSLPVVGSSVTSKTIGKRATAVSRERVGVTQWVKRGDFYREDKEAADWFGKYSKRALWTGIILLVNIGLISTSFIARVMRDQRYISEKGAALKKYLDGLKYYIGVGETERLKMLQSPEGAQKIGEISSEKGAVLRLYERVLPYAILFNQEKQWSAQLESMYRELNTRPEWDSTVGSGYEAVALSSMINGFSSSVASASAPSSSTGYSSSSGGSSGGGFSGGGGGGGGGGGW